MSDTFAQWRKSPIQPHVSATVADSSSAYLAFEAKDRVERLEIRPASAPIHAAGYGSLLDIVFDRSGTNFVLLFSFMMVLVRGRNLHSVFAALKNGTASFIEEFDSDRWTDPKDPKLPFIESIKVVAKKEGPPLEEMESSFAPPREKMH